MTREHYARLARESCVTLEGDALESLTYDDALAEVAEGVTA